MHHSVDLDHTIRILMIDAGGELPQRVAPRLVGDGFEITVAATLAAAAEELESNKFTVVVVEPQLPDCDECDCLARIRATDRRVRLIVYTRGRSYELARTAVNLGAFVFLENTGDASDVDAIVANVRRAARRGFSEQFFHGMVEAAPTPLGITHEGDGVIVLANAPLCRLFGMSPEGLVGRRTPDLYANPADRTILLAAIQRTGRLRDHEIELKRSDGTTFWGSISVAPITLDGERCMYVAVNDITERKRTDQVLRDSEARLKEAQQIARLGNWVWDLRTGSLNWSEELYRIHGIEPHERGDDIREFLRKQVHPDDRSAILEGLERVVQSGGGRFEHTGRIVRPDGSVRTLLRKGLMQCDDAGKPVLMIGTTQDITEQQEAVESLRREKEFSELLIESSFDGILAFDRQYRYTVWNSAMERMSGVPASETLGRSAFDVFPFLRDIGEDRLFDAALAGETIVAQDRPYHVPDTGKEGFFEAHYSPLKDASGEVVGGLGIIRETTERKRAQEALEESEAMFRALAETNPLMVAIYQGTQHKYVNPAAEILSGYSLAELKEIEIPLLVHPDNREMVRARSLARQRGDEVPSRYEMHIIRKDGTPRWIDFSAAPIQYGGKPAVIGIAADITERKEAEEALRKSEERLELALVGAELAMWDWNLATNKVYIDEQWARILGRDLTEIQMDIGAWKEAVHPDDEPVVWELVSHYLAGDTSGCEAEYRIRTGSGDWKWIHSRGKIVERDSAGRPLRMAGTHRDIDERKRIEAERRRLEAEAQTDQKLKSLGLLAGGIAHDFNNLLLGVLGHAELARNKLLEPSAAGQCIAKIETAAERAAELCNQLLAYSGRGRFVVEVLDLDRLVVETTNLLDTNIPPRVSLMFEPSEIGPSIEGDASQITRVIMNLITNAVDAIGSAEGRITIRTGIEQMDEQRPLPTYSGEVLSAGQYAFCEVCDTGAGMTKETMDRMFEPFFTSKFAGRGLGLAAVQGIVRGHRGAIQVTSAPGIGTTIRVLFPASREAKPVSPSPRHAAAKPQRTGTILVVDDTEIVRTVTREVLEQAGYQVITAENGQQCLELFSAHRERIQAVLLDLTMPHLDGDRTLRELKRMRIDVPVVLTSGYDEQETANRFREDGPAGFLQKPYLPHVLIQKMEDVLNGS